MQSCCIYGTGGHAKVIQELALMNDYEAVCFFDDNAGINGLFRGLPAIQYNESAFPELPVIIAIGNNHVRKEIMSRMRHTVFSLRHPSSIMSAQVVMGEGTVILGGAVVQTDVNIGKHCIINIGCSIDHDVIIEDFVHIAPNSYIGGGGHVGTGATIGAGAVIMRNVHVPAWTDVPPNTVVR